MGRKKRNNSGFQQQNSEEAAKRAKPETGETFLVKKYRAEKHFASMDAFVRYTKAHRMLDAAYVRWNVGVTAEKPFVFSTRVGGTDLGWGRGRTREAAMDCAVRAAFALVNAHGYKNFPLDDDCLMQAPTDAPTILPPPPPPPPNIMGVPPPHPGLPPLPPPPHHNGILLPPPPPPHGLPPPPPPPPPPPATDTIPQPVLPQAPVVASSLLLSQHQQQPSAPGSITAPAVTPATPVSMTIAAKHAAEQKKASTVLKGGLTLVYDPTDNSAEEVSMEERRAVLPRYQKMLIRARANQGASGKAAPLE